MRDPLRNGADDDELKEIIGAAVCNTFHLLVLLKPIVSKCEILLLQSNSIMVQNHSGEKEESSSCWDVRHCKDAEQTDDPYRRLGMCFYKPLSVLFLLEEDDCACCVMLYKFF